MGSHAEFASPGVFEGGGSNGYAQGHHHKTQTKATIPGMTALASVAALLVSIISAAVPHWGSYGPHHLGITSGFLASLSDPHGQGNFGPFQICYDYGISVCGGYPGGFQTREFIKVAGACSILVVFSLSGLAFFSILHVAMRLQRTEICVSFARAGFLKVVFSAVAALGSLLACIFGGVEFEVLGREARFSIDIGVCYYLQIILIFVNILFLIVCYITYKKDRRNPPLMVPKQRGIPGYDNHNANNGVAMTASSQYPHSYRHGQPIQPIRPQSQQSQLSQYNNNAPQLSQLPNGGTAGYNVNDLPVFPRPQPGPQQPSSIQGHSNNGFTPVSLVVPQQSSPTQVVLPVVTSTATSIGAVPLNNARPIPIQAVQPQMQPRVQVLPSPTNNGGHLPSVSFTPGGRHAQSANPGGAGHGGSMESLNSTLSSTLSFGSTTSTGSGVSKELRSSLKKPKNKDTASVSSKTSSKQVRISLGQEQTQV